MKRVTVVLPTPSYKQLKLRSFTEDTTMNALILEAVQKYMSTYPDQKLMNL